MSLMNFKNHATSNMLKKDNNVTTFPRNSRDCEPRILYQTKLLFNCQNYRKLIKHTITQRKLNSQPLPEETSWNKLHSTTILLGTVLQNNGWRTFTTFNCNYKTKTKVWIQVTKYHINDIGSNKGEI